MNGMEIKYAELLRLSVRQLFYRNKLYKQNTVFPEPDMLIIPTDNCLDVMNRLNMVCKTTDIGSGIVVLARVSGKNAGGDDVLRFSARPQDLLTFLLILKNKDAANFNDLPAHGQANRVYYFSNEISDAGATRDDLHLSKVGLVDGANDCIKSSQYIFRYHHNGTVAPGTSRVRHVVSGQYAEPTSINNEAGESDLVFDLSSLPMGKCELLIANGFLDEFYYLGGYESQKVFGVIELFLSSAIAPNYRIIEAEQSLISPRPVFTITFNNRKTIWRYTIQLQDTSPLFLEMTALSPADKIAFIQELDIVTNDNTITFSRGAFSDKELVFLSDHPLPLHEKYISSTTHEPLSLYLKKYIGNIAKEEAVKSNLPFPSTAGIDATALPDIFSDIFLTI